jgi:hypothetical protein
VNITVSLTEDGLTVEVTDVHPVNSDTARDIASELALRINRELNPTIDGPQLP